MICITSCYYTMLLHLYYLNVVFTYYYTYDYTILTALIRAEVETMMEVHVVGLSHHKAPEIPITYHSIVCYVMLVYASVVYYSIVQYIIVQYIVVYYIVLCYSILQYSIMCDNIL